MVARRLTLLAMMLATPAAVWAQSCVGAMKSPGAKAATRYIGGRLDIADGANAYGGHFGVSTQAKPLNVQMGARLISGPGTGSVVAIDMNLAKALWQSSPDNNQICGLVGFDYIDVGSNTSTSNMDVGLSWGSLLSPKDAATRFTYFIQAGILLSVNSVTSDNWPFVNFGGGIELKNGLTITPSYRKLIDDVIDFKPVFRIEVSWPLGTTRAP